jgi:tetratricopeptide (TPR) repeat protein
LEEALALCRLHEIPVWFPGTASALGHAYFLGGRRTEGLALLEQAVERADAMEQVFAHALRLVLLADALLSLGRPKEAETQAVKALETATQHQEAGSIAHAWRALGRVTAEGDVKRAQTSYAQAAQVAERLGMRPLLAHCHLGLGQLLTRTGSPEADQHLHAAETLYAELDMGFWREHPNAGPQKNSSERQIARA